MCHWPLPGGCAEAQPDSPSAAPCLCAGPAQGAARAPSRSLHIAWKCARRRSLKHSCFRLHLACASGQDMRNPKQTPAGSREKRARYRAAPHYMRPHDASDEPGRGTMDRNARARCSGESPQHLGRRRRARAAEAHAISPALPPALRPAEAVVAPLCGAKHVGWGEQQGGPPHVPRSAPRRHPP